MNEAENIIMYSTEIVWKHSGLRNNNWLPVLHKLAGIQDTTEGLLKTMTTSDVLLIEEIADMSETLFQTAMVHFNETNSNTFS